MPEAATIRRLIASTLVSTAMLCGAIVVADRFSIKGCETRYWLPSIHCRWDLGELFNAAVAAVPAPRSGTGGPEPD